MRCLPRCVAALALAFVLGVAPVAAQQQALPAPPPAPADVPADTADRQRNALTLGTLSFPNSGSEAAQQAFKTGLLALHSFWYPEARDRFQKAQRLDPGFAMAYWGEAMTHEHGLWEQHDGDAGRAVLAALDSAKAAGAVETTEREQAYLSAVRTLYEGNGDISERRAAYAEEMTRLAERFSGDEEATLFAALARMAAPRFALDDADEVVNVAAPLEALYKDMTRHPGVLHYLIHAYDSKTFAPMGLRMARTYAEVAPASSHALHMPSHIFRRLERWEDMAASNVDAYQASVQWQKRSGRPLRMRDFHAYRWLFDAYMAQDQYDKTQQLISRLEGLVEKAERRGEDPGYMPELADRLRKHQEQRTMTE
jgi:hypothetical protein